jgi:hypothetical protein
MFLLSKFSEFSYIFKLYYICVNSTHAYSICRAAVLPLLVQICLDLSVLERCLILLCLPVPKLGVLSYYYRICQSRLYPSTLGSVCIRVLRRWRLQSSLLCLSRTAHWSVLIQWIFLLNIQSGRKYIVTCRGDYRRILDCMIGFTDTLHTHTTRDYR